MHCSSFYEIAEKKFHDVAYNFFDNQSEGRTPKASLYIQTPLEFRYLTDYGSREGLKVVIDRIYKRTRFPSDFASAEKHIYDQMGFYEDCFLQLY